MDSSQVIGTVIVIIVLTVVLVLPIITLALKGKYGMIIAGVFLHPCWWIGAIRLAKPNSYWARRFYGPVTLRRAQARFSRY